MGLLVASVAKVFRLCRCLYSSLFLACAQDPSERRAWKGEKQEFKPGELTAWNICMCFSNLHAQASFYSSQDTREVVTWAEGLKLGAATKERLVTGKVSEPEDMVALLQLEMELGILLPLFPRQALLLFGHMRKVLPASQFGAVSPLRKKWQKPWKSTFSSSALQRCHKLNQCLLYRAPPLENAGPEIFLWAHKVKDREGHESPHYVPLLPQSAMPAQGGGGQTSSRLVILPDRLARTYTRRVRTWSSNFPWDQGVQARRPNEFASVESLLLSASMSLVIVLKLKGQAADASSEWVQSCTVSQWIRLIFFMNMNVASSDSSLGGRPCRPAKCSGLTFLNPIEPNESVVECSCVVVIVVLWCVVSVM